MTATGTIERHFPARHDGHTPVLLTRLDHGLRVVFTVAGEPPTTMAVTFDVDQADLIAVDVRKIIFQIRRQARASRSKASRR